MAEKLSIEQQVAATIRRHQMVVPGETVLVAVSGGPDSTSLLHLLHSLRDQLQIKLEVGHLNHMLRGEAAQEDARFVEDLASSLSLPSHTEAIDVQTLARREKLSEEQAARVARYRWLEQVADRIGARKIAVGHSADDLAETVLLNLLRGSGVEGLGGIPPVRGRIIRPLLEVWRDEIEVYCSQRGLNPRIDASNQDLSYLRNRIRHQLLPLLTTEYQDNVKDILVRLADVARQETDHLRSQTEQSLEELIISSTPEQLSISLEKLADQPKALQRRLIREAVRRLKGDIVELSFVHVEAVLDLMSSGGEKRLNLPLGLSVRKRGEELIFGTLHESKPSRQVLAGLQRQIAVPGTTNIPELGISLQAEIFPATHPFTFDQSNKARIAYLDWDTLHIPLTIRTWSHGDRFLPLGAPGTIKLHDFFINSKIPQEERYRIPLLVSGVHIIWLVGWRINERFKVTTLTKRVLRLQVKEAKQRFR